MKYFILFFLLFSAIDLFSQNTFLDKFQNQKDIGNPKVKGNTLYNPEDQSYTLKGGGYNIWFNRDEFQYAYNKLRGDFILTANLKLLGDYFG